MKVLKNRKSRECKKQHNLKFNECTKVRNICNKSLNELRVLIKHMKVKHPGIAESIKNDSKYKCIKPYCTYLEGYKAKCKFCKEICSVASSSTTFKKHLKWNIQRR